MSNRSHRSKRGARKPAPSVARRPAVLAGLAFAVLVIIVLIVSLAGRSGGGLPASISVDEAHQKYLAGTYILDVRTQAEWDEYHAPGTTLIPFDELPQRLSELPRDREIIVVCRSGNRSQQGRDILLNAGFRQVTSMDGGLKAWRDKGYPIQTGP